MAVCEISARLGLVRVELECQCEVPQDQLALAVTGSIPQLGNWNLKDALIAEQVPMHSGKWVVGVKLPAGLDFQYKWVIVWRDSLSPFLWEDGANRFTHIEESGRYICAWNSGAVFQPVIGTSGFALSSPPVRNPQLQDLISILEEIAQSVNEHCERNGNVPRSPPRGILYTVYNFIKSGIVRVCSWLWQKLQSFWHPTPPPPPQEEDLGTWV
ncbi:uncharacterized protein LOC133204980 [Saccostrea echinata]|uniref:uncharacterized protein LOC133204980 n=1 Tax=Saccostrea echinata TaxID=191078 RepID=UPI002A81F347|nr:uncharacterized protein LOC133204980 [Saccostrea echinata]